MDDCADCEAARGLLSEKSVKLTYFNMDEEAVGQAYKEGLAEWTNKREPPYVFVAHEFVGGPKELAKLIASTKNIRNYINKKLNPFDDSVEA